ncbi:MAG: type II secretion system protein [Candidatus Omnitrophica bacterium]|nr:type II secretion system protein [Candidatus Omnitrophota bacterium]
MVIVVVSILAIVAVPKFVDLSGDAKKAAEAGVAGGVRSGIMIQLVKNKAYPATLDNAANGVCSKTNVCFTTVLDTGISEQWERVSAAQYKGPTGTFYFYNPTTGAFAVMDNIVALPLEGGVNPFY